MPFIRTTTNKPVSKSTADKITAACGQAITLLRGKTEEWLMVEVTGDKNLYFQGKEMLVQDIAAKCGAQRLYIMLGCLDFQVSSASQQLAQNWNILVDKILSKSPDMEIVIISNIPCYTEEPAFAEYNQKVAAAAVELKQMAMDRGFGYIDLGYYIQDHYGNMPAVYSRDTYHMNPDGSVEWMKIMRHYARFEQEGGILK